MIGSHLVHPLRAPARWRGSSSRRPSAAMTLAAALAGVALATAACGGGSAGGTAGGSGSKGAKGKTIDFVGYGKDNPWGAHFNTVFGAKLEAAGVKIVDLTTMDPGTAVTNFNQAISNRPDLIVASLLDTSSMVVPIRKAKQANIPVLVFDGRPDPSVDGDVMQVLSDSEALGTAAAQNLIEGLTAQGKNSGNIIVITGTKSGFAAQDRMKGFGAEMAKSPEYKVIDTQDGNWDPTLSGKIATQLFAKYGCSGIQGAYGMADYMALPIIAAAKQAGCEVAGKNGVIVTGSNCFKVGIEAIKAGTLYGTATEDPGTIAEQTASYVIRYLNGENPPAKEIVKEERVTAKTVEQYAAQCSNA
jgi:ABC-type sugar transport system substrate-binding protein